MSIKYLDTVQVCDRATHYHGWTGQVTSVASYSITVEFRSGRRKELNRRGNPRPVTFRPEQLVVVSRASAPNHHWQPPKMPWDE